MDIQVDVIILSWKYYILLFTRIMIFVLEFQISLYCTTKINGRQTFIKLSFKKLVAVSFLKFVGMYFTRTLI